jgi:hypothetical protein
VAGDERGYCVSTRGKPIVQHRSNRRTLGKLVKQGCPLGLQRSDVVASEGNVVAVQRFAVAQRRAKFSRGVGCSDAQGFVGVEDTGCVAAGVHGRIVLFYEPGESASVGDDRSGERRLIAEFFQAAGDFVGSRARVLGVFVSFYGGEQVLAAGESDFGLDLCPEAGVGRSRSLRTFGRSCVGIGSRQRSSRPVGGR